MNILALLFSFCGGAFGAAIGALAAFEFVGIVGLCGIAIMASGSKFDFMGVVAFGPVFGPHISFAGAAAAASYAKKKGYLETGKDVSTALVGLKKPSVLAIGGIMGMIGYLTNFVLGTFMVGKIDTVATSVVVVAIISKIAFNPSGTLGLFGDVPEQIKKLGGRYSVKSTQTWVPYVNTASEKLMVAVAVGGLSAYITYLMLKDPSTIGAAPYVGFCISAISLLWLQFGISIPPSHHITLCASYGVLASHGNLLWGIGGAIIAAFIGDFLGRTFYVFGDCHVDPPAMAIMSTSLILLGIFPLAGVYSTGMVVPIIIIAVVSIYAFFQYSKLKKETIDANLKKDIIA